MKKQIADSDSFVTAMELVLEINGKEEDMSILINDLTVTFKNNVTAIDHGNLEIPKGIFGLLGEKGA